MSERSLMRGDAAARTLRACLGAGLVAIVVALLSALAPPAFATEGQPWWHLESQPAPTLLKPHASGQIIEVQATNFGTAAAAEADGSAASIRIADSLPAGLTATAITGGTSNGFVDEVGETPQATCTLAPLECKWNVAVPPFATLKIDITLEVNASPGTLVNEATVEGGGAAPVTVRRKTVVSEAETTFGVENYELTPESEAGAPELQAGSHPFQLTTTLDFNQTPIKTIQVGKNGTTKTLHTAPALPKDVSVKLPPGLVANVTAIKQCSALDFSTIHTGNINSCPADTAIGVATVIVSEPKVFGFFVESVPVFNLVPSRGEPARFGFETTQVPVVLDTAIEAGGDYHAVVSVKNASQSVTLLGSQVTIWGVPGDPRHDASRGWACITGGRFHFSAGECSPLGEANPPAFLIMPTQCGSMTSSVAVDSWAEPGAVLANGAPNTSDPRWKTTEAEPFDSGTLTGCGELPFSPTTEVQMDQHRASSPSGVNVTVAVPQQSTLSAGGLAEADVSRTEVKLPVGVQASPGAANGLESCTVQQSGFAGADGDKPPLLEAQLEEQRFGPEAVSCPESSKIGTVDIETPLLANHLTGSVYLASQDTNPFQSPLVLYLIAEDPVSGVRIKLAGNVVLDQQTGQLTSTFANSPPLPFSKLKLHLFDGPRASQSTPALCGSYTTGATLAPSSGNLPASAPSSFAITEGANGGPCQTSAPQSFSPSFTAGPTSSQAGGYTSFTLTIDHSDADQQLSGVTTSLPPGAAAMLSSIAPCAEPPAGQPWSCGADSLIGHATSSSGFGSAPFTLGGQVYLTSGYDGAPFGLLVSTNAEHAGPFNLGVIDVRSRIDVDRNTAAVTITTDAGPHGDGFPTRIKGVPVDLKQINVTVDRPNFEFNPTNCGTPLSIAGTLSGDQGGSQSVSASYPVTNCGALAFAPKLTASTRGNASKVNGASLTVKVESSPGQANIAKTKLVLPIALPSRLTTIQKACLDSVFEANAAGCPEGSNIGTATVHTPVLKNPLTGPAYLVSHGSAAFPDVEFVLQGEGITLILDGQTDIKKGITTSTFNSVPDAPVTTFETVLPEGPHSALTSNVAASKRFSLCGAKLVMPTTITGQNGVVIQQQTKIPVAGCAAVKGFKVTRAQKLAKALKKCRKQFKHSKNKRAACEKKARKQFGPKKPAHKKSKAKKK
jgi:hypothetical protein